LSRSITQLSKKLIFHLHRGATLPSPAARAKVIQEGKHKEREIYKLFDKIWAELKGGEGEEESFWRFNRQV
jgi:predicted translin family RNA/ssDNA-binding protein